MLSVRRGSWSSFSAAAAAAVAGFFFWPAGSVAAFKIPVHENICEEALGSYSVVVDGELLAFTQEAIEEIIEANVDTDDIENQLFESKAHWHFDNEKLYKGSQRLISEKQNAVNALVMPDEPDGEDARQHLGTGIHTLQDFYAHTNWVNYNFQINPDLGKSIILNPSQKTEFCPNNVGLLEGPSQSQLTSGYFVLPSVCLLFVKPILIYACATSRCGVVPHPGKCRHGLEETLCLGINKDEKGRPLFGIARSQARDATTDYVDKLLDHTFIKNHPDKLKLIKELFGMSTEEKSGGDLIIVVDDTGSMGNDISQVKQQVKNIIESSEAPAKYVLVRFGDPDVGPPFTSTDATKFLERVNQLSPGGGGDCAEKSMTALLQAISVSSKNSNIFLFSDADAKDQNLASQVSTNAVEKDITIYAVLSGSCRRRRGLGSGEQRQLVAFDPAYSQITESTGGQIFSVARGDVGSIFDFLRPQLSGSFFTIMRKREGNDGTAAFASLDLPIDSSVEVVVVSVSYDQGKTVSLFRPTGEAVVDSDLNVTITEQAKGIFFTINDPPAGLWNITVAGSGPFTVLAKGRGALRMASFKLVEPKFTHGGLAYRAISGQPVEGSSPAGLAKLTGPYSVNTKFRIVDEYGHEIQILDFAQGSPLAADSSWSGNFSLPDVPFRIEVYGMDRNGTQFQRVYPELFDTKTVVVGVAFNQSVPYLPYNLSVVTLGFEVRNYDYVATTFAMVASDDRSFLVGDPASVSNLFVDANSTEIFEVSLRSPPAEECIQDLRVALTVTATSTSDSNSFNSHTKILHTDCNFALVADPDEAFLSDPPPLPDSDTSKGSSKSKTSSKGKKGKSGKGKKGKSGKGKKGKKGEGKGKKRNKKANNWKKKAQIRNKKKRQNSFG